MPDIHPTYEPDPSNPDDARLLAEANSVDGFDGPRNFARVLLTVPPYIRPAIVAEGTYIGNRAGGRPSDALSSAARGWLWNGEFSSPTARSLAERAA